MTEDNQDVTFQKLIDKYLNDDPHFFIEQAFKNTCRNKSLSHDNIEVLKYELGEKIVERVERVDRTKPILLVGSNDALVKGTLALIWNTHPLIPKVKLLLGSGNNRVYFVDKNCSGMTEDEIRKDLFYPSEKRPDENDLAEVMHQRTLFKRKMSECLKPLMNLYNNLCILSLRGLEGKQHENILKRIIVEVEERKSNFEGGFLVVGIDSTDNLPQKFKDQFEPIYLEPEKQDIPASTPKDTAEVQGRLIPLPVPSGTQWNEVSISFLDNENVSIKIKSKTIKKHYVEIGFKDERKSLPVPVKSWEFLKCLARLNGRFNSYQNTKKNDIEKSISELKKILVEIFKIEGNPIPYKKRGCSGVESKTDNPKKKRQDRAGYVTAFRIEDKSHSREYEESVINHNRKYVPPPKKHGNYKDENAGYNPDNYDRDNLEDE